MKEVTIKDDYITLGQFLKYVDLISFGGEAKMFLNTNLVYINDEKDNRRGRKIKDKDIVKIMDHMYKVVKNDS